MKHRRGSARGIDKHVCGKQGSKREAKGKQKGSKREQKGAKGSGASRANPRGTRILDGVCVQDLEAKTLPISLNAALAARVLLTCEGAKPREMSILDCVKYLSLRRYREGLP
jgi:hypothetical protein